MKKQSIAVIVGLSFLVGAAVTYGFIRLSFPHHDMMDMKHDESMMHDTVSPGMHRMPDGSLMGNGIGHTEMGPMPSMDHSMMMVKSEREFLEGMIPHHQEAVDTAKEVLARGGSTPEIRQLAEDIIVAQEQEIALMKTWYQDWYGEIYAGNPATYQPMMRDLSSLSGAALDRVFLEDMVMHHMGAIMMAESVEPYITQSEISELTQTIIETQTTEIPLMRSLLSELESI